MQWLVVLLLLVIIGILLFSWGQSSTGRKVIIEQNGSGGDWWGPWWGPWWRSGGHNADWWPWWRRTNPGGWPGPWHPPHGRFPGPRPGGHPGPLPIPGTRHLLG